MILILQIIAFVTGLLYIFQAARLKRSCWIYGGISSLILVYLFLEWKYYVDSVLNIYYVIMAFVGWFQWKKHTVQISIGRLTFSHTTFAVATTVAIASTLAFIMHTYTDATYPILDSFAGSLSITATWLTAKRKIENWPFWIIANAMVIYLCILKAEYIIMGLMVAYFILSVVGWVQWYKQLKHA